MASAGHNHYIFFYLASKTFKMFTSLQKGNLWSGEMSRDATGTLFYPEGRLSVFKCLIAAKVSNTEKKFRKAIVKNRTDFRWECQIIVLLVLSIYQPSVILLRLFFLLYLSLFSPSLSQHRSSLSKCLFSLDKFPFSTCLSYLSVCFTVQ